MLPCVTLSQKLDVPLKSTTFSSELLLLLLACA